MSDLFYLQDSRSYVGNDVMWWAKDAKGYTTDVSKAQLYTQRQATEQHERRHSDIPWPKQYIDAKVRPAVDMQYIKRDEALAGTGIVIKKDKPMRDTYKCNTCHRFMTAAVYYTAPCENCGTENRP